MPPRVSWCRSPDGCSACRWDTCWRVLWGRATGEAFGLDIAFASPLLFVAVALVGTAVLALLVMQPPLRRAVRFPPGEALHCA